ncbi:MAG: redoxin domain-containing protein [Bdellovibrionales bacterium]
MFKKFALTALAAFMLGAPISAKAEPVIGQPAPEFSLPAHDGSTQTLSAFKGKVVVLEWFNPGCPFVLKHYDTKNMQNLQKEITRPRTSSG